MGYVNSSPEDDYRINATAQANAATQITPDHWYDGLATTVPRGLTNAFLKTNTALNDLLSPVDRYLGLENFNKAMSVDIPKGLEEWAKPDARWQGAPARTIQGVTEGLGLAFAGAALAGPAGAATLLGGVEGNAAYHEQREQGVDENTSLKVAGLTGAMNAASVFLPMTLTRGNVTGLIGRAMEAEVAGNTTLAKSLYTLAETVAPVAGKLPTAVGVGAGVSVGFGAAGRALTGDVLRANGYKEMADQYRAMDGESVVADLILGAAFGGLAHLHEGSPVRPSDVDAAMATKKQEHFDRAGLGIQTDPLAANVHHDVMLRSLEDLVMGRAPEVAPHEADILTRNVVPDPQTESALALQRESVAEVFAAHDEMGRPELLLDRPVEPLPLPEPAPVQTPKTPDATPAPTVDMHPMVRETMNQLVAKNPEMLIRLGDGREVKLSDLPNILSEHMQSAEKDSVLHDVAAACFTRTSL